MYAFFGNIAFLNIIATATEYRDYQRNRYHTEYAATPRPMPSLTLPRISRTLQYIITRHYAISFHYAIRFLHYHFFSFSHFFTVSYADISCRRRPPAAYGQLRLRQQPPVSRAPFHAAEL